MPTVVGIFIFISRENFMLSWVKHEKSFITLGPDHRFCCLLKFSTESNSSVTINEDWSECKHNVWNCSVKQLVLCQIKVTTHHISKHANLKTFTFSILYNYTCIYCVISFAYSIYHKYLGMHARAKYVDQAKLLKPVWSGSPLIALQSGLGIKCLAQILKETSPRG